MESEGNFDNEETIMGTSAMKNQHISELHSQKVHLQTMETHLKHMEHSLRLVGGLIDWPIRCKPRAVLLLLYHVTVWCTMTGYFCSRFLAYVNGLKNKDDLPKRIAIALYAIIHVGSFLFITFLYNLTKFSVYKRKLYFLWGKYKHQYGSQWKSFDQMTLITVLCCWSLALLNVIVYWLTSAHHKETGEFFIDWMLTCAFPQTPEEPLLSVINSIGATFFLHASFLQYMILGVLSLLILELTRDFNKLNNDFAEKVKNSKRRQLPDILHNFYKRHSSLSDVSGMVDHIFSTMVFGIFVTGIITICLMLYITIYSPPLSSTRWIYTTTVPFIAFYVIVIVIISFMCERLSKSAHGCVKLLYQLDFNKSKSFSNSFALEYNCFLTRLNNTEIGITGWKFFIINRTSVKKMVLMVLTYTIILLRMGPGYPSSIQNTNTRLTNNTSEVLSLLSNDTGVY